MTARQRRSARSSAVSRRGRSLDATQVEVDGNDVPGLIVRDDPLRTRVDKLTKEHDRLLREIAKKRVHLEAAETLSREVFSTLLNRTMPTRESLRGALRDIQRLFARLLGATSPLNRRDKAKVRRVYEDLVVALDLPTLEPDAEPKRAHHSRPGSNASARPDFGAGGYSAPKPAEATHASLRALFKRLARAFHPDQVQDEHAKAERTSVMKDVTKAYEAGDLARLMELERALLTRLPVGDAPDALLRRVNELLAANTELRRQQRSLTAALKELSLELPFDVNLKAADARQRALREIDSLVSDLEQEERRVTALRDFVLAFADGQMSIADFLAGPTLDDPAVGSDLGEDLLLDLIEELIADTGGPTRARGPGRSGTGRRRA